MGKFSSSNITGDILHGAVYSTKVASAVVHLHSPAVVAVSCLREGFQPPLGSSFEGRVAYHDWEGFSDDPDECDRISSAIRATPGCAVVVLRNHGAMVFGSTVEVALACWWSFDAECCAQLAMETEDVSNDNVA